MRSSTWKMALGLGCALSLLGCKLNRSDDVDENPAPPVAPAPAPTPEAPAAPAANEVVRYSGLEVEEDQSTLTVVNTVRARRAADFTSELVETLPPGAQVAKVARYAGFTLVAWDSANAGPRQGWIDGNQATRTLALVPTTTTTVTTTVPVVAVKPVAVTPATTTTFKPIAPKPGVTPAPTTPKPVAVTPPKPTSTAKPPALTPKPASPKPGVLKPPKLGK